MDLSLMGAIIGAAAGIALDLVLILARGLSFRSRIWVGVACFILAVLLLIRAASVARPGSDDEAIAVCSGSFLFVHFFVGLIALAVAYGARSTREQYARFTELAKKLGVQGPGEVPKVKWYQAVPQPWMAGNVGTHQIRMQQRLVRTGKNSYIYLDFFVSVSSAGKLSFRLSQDGVLTKIFGVFASPEISLGDPEMDEAFYLKGSPETAIKAFFQRHDVRKILMENRQYAECQCEKGWLTSSSLGGIQSDSRQQWAEKKIAVLLKLASILDETPGNRAPEA